MKNIEQHIKSELENREITPTPMAWEKISEEIKNKSKRPIGFIKYIAIAASFVLVSVLFWWNKTSKDTLGPIEVITNADKEEIEPIKKVPLKSNSEYTLAQDNDLKEDNNVETKNEKSLAIEIQEVTQNTTPRTDSQDFREEHFANYLVADVETPIEIIDYDEEFLLAENATQIQEKTDTPKVQKRVNVNPEKLLFMIENEDARKKESKVAFQNNTIAIELND